MVRIHNSKISSCRWIGPFVALLLNLLIALGMYFIARVEFLLENYSYFSEDLTFSHLCSLFAGSLPFDKSAIAYTNSLYILMMLFPKWLFIVVNTIALVINLCDSVYFPYTLRRTTTSVFHEFRNETNLGDVFWGELLGHWYLLLLAVVVVWLAWKLYVMPRTDAKQLLTVKQRLIYTGVYTVLLVFTGYMTVGACRGGWASGIRPITINNANDHHQQCQRVCRSPHRVCFGTQHTLLTDSYGQQRRV